MRVGKNQGREEKIEVLGNGPIPDVKLGAVQVVGETPGTTMVDGSSIDNGQSRETVNMAEVAPVIADATTRSKPLPEGTKFPALKKYRVENQGGKHVNETGGGGRIFLHEGKEITSQYYDIRRLQQQGVRLRDITDVDDDAPIPT